MRRIYTYISLLILLLFTTAVTAQYEQIQDLNEHIVKGRLRLKLKQEVFQQGTGLKSLDVANTTETSIGVTGIDRIGKQIGITRINRVFPFSLKNEPKHREYGLHLWLEVEFDSHIDVEYAVELYKEADEVAIAKPLFKKVRLDGDQKPVRYKAGKLLVSREPIASAATLKSAAVEPITPNDPLFGQQWHYETNLEKYENGKDIELSKAWTISSGDSTVIVAIVDGGIDINHEDLAENLWVNQAELNGEEGVDDDQNGFVDDINGYNFVFGGQITPHAHGTHVAGTVGAVTNNGVGVAGVAGGGVKHTEDGATYTDNGVRMISCQVFDDRSSTSGNFAAAIVYGADNGAVISQNSWGYTVPNYYEPEVYDAIKYFVAEAGQYEGSPMKGGILFFAAGNDGLEQTHYPATFDEVVAVTSLGPEGYPAAYTNYGEWTDIAAPGGDQMYYEHEGGVLSTLPYNEYGFFQGTSMACPHVSGVAALVLTKYGGAEMTPENLRNRIVNSTKRFVFEHQGKYGSGMLNAPNALANDEKLPPEAIKDLEATEIYHNEVRLQWTIPVDPDNFQPSVIYLALSGSEITSDNFDLKPQLAFENPFDAGTQVQVNIGGLIKQTDYWFAIKTEDQFGNISDISNIVTITTTDSPQFDLSTNTINVNIDVATGTTYSELIQLSNVGEGIIYWQNYVENERFYWQEEQVTTEAQVAAKLDFATNNPELFEAPVNPQTQIMTLKSSEIVAQPTDYWEYDETVFKAGMSYENGKAAQSLLSTYNSNAGLVQATRFNVDYDYTFNLTHLEVAMYNNTNEKPIIVELRKGSTRIEESEVIYMQEYYADTTEVFGFQRIPLYKPHRFEDGEIFWVILHFPKEDLQPLGLAVDQWYPAVFLMSRDNGRSYFDLQTWRDGPYIPLVRALSTGDDGAYVFLKPGQGEVAAGESKDVEVYIDATNLSEGKHLASVTMMTNDDNKAYVSMEVNVNVSGQLPNIDTTKVHDVECMTLIENEEYLTLENNGLAPVEVYDVEWASARGVSIRNFEDTVHIYQDYSNRVPFRFTPNGTEPMIWDTKLVLITNYGDISVPVSVRFKEVAEMVASVGASAINLAYGQEGDLELTIRNTGASESSILEYDLSHYTMLNKENNRMPDALSYNIVTSEDIGGPLAGSWDDISEIGTVYDGVAVWEDTLNLGARIPFFNEVMETAWHGFEGVIYFYETLENGVQLPANDARSVGLGAMAPLLFNDSSKYFPVKEFIHYSFGDKNVFTVTVKERINGNPNADSDEMTYQVVLYRNGAVEYRYKDVSALTPEMEYIVAIHGFTKDEFAVYKNLNDPDKGVYNGLVVRFEPVNDASMILYADQDKGALSAGEEQTVNLRIDPSMYDSYAGTYTNEIELFANTADKQAKIPFTINISGAESLEATDTLTYAVTNIGHTSTKLLQVTNKGSDVGSIQSITFSNPAFDCQVALPYAIHPMAHRYLPVEFSPVAIGNLNATMTLTYSNGISETVRLESEGRVDPGYTHTIPATINIDVEGGQTTRVPFSVSALSSGANLELSFINGVHAQVSTETLAKASEKNGVKVNGLYGYTWQTDTMGVFHKWDSIEEDAEILQIKDGKQFALDLPFEFPFYGEMHDSLWISKNGYVTVVEPNGEPFSLDFEENDGLAGMIAPFWSPLDPAEEGDGVWLKVEADRVVVEWNNAKPVVSGAHSNGGNVTFQLELMADGRIYFHYKDLQYFEGVLQYGLESPDETEHLNKPRTWILPWTDLYDNRTIAIAPPLKSELTAGQSLDFTMDVDGNRFYQPGAYRDTVVLLTNSYSQPELEIPVVINVTGNPVFSNTDSLKWEEVIYKQGITVKDGFKVTNIGYDKATITHVKSTDIADFVLLDEDGEAISIASTGKLTYPIEVKPWEVKSFDIVVLVDEYSNEEGTISFEGNFGTSEMSISIMVVDSPVFDWNATNQSFNINASEGGSYSFEVVNKGETILKYDLTPAVVPVGDGENGSAIIKETGNYTFDLPNVVDSLAIDTKTKADGIFTPIAGGANLSFCNRFVAPEGGMFITHIKAWTYLKQLDQYVNVMIYAGGDDAHDPDKDIRINAPQSGTKLYEQNYVIDEQTDGQWVIYPLAKPVTIAEGETFYIMVAPPVDRSFIGYDINTNQKVQENTFVGVYWADGEYKWYSNVYESWSNEIYKIRPLTAAGKGQWIELDNYSGELLSGETATITASFDANMAGPGSHKAKLIVKSNDVNRASEQVDINLNVNGAPEVIYHPNTDVDTLRIAEWDELVINMVADDPEGENLTFNLVEDAVNPEVEFKQLDAHSIQMKLRTGYDGQGVYTYHININDEAGNVTRDSILVEVVDKNRAPYLNPDLGIIYLNMADASQGYTLDGNELFIDPDGDELQILAGNYTPEIVDLALGNRFITINPLQEGTGFLVFAADDGKDGGFVIYGVYVVVINDASAVDGRPNEFVDPEEVLSSGILSVQPNPVVSGNAKIYYSVESQGNVVLEIYDITGKKCEAATVGYRDEGKYMEIINVSTLSNGLYLCRYSVDGAKTATVKMVIKQ